MVNGMLGTMAMVNYPYPTSFIEPMPAWPVHAACDAALAVPITQDSDYILALQQAASIYYNYTGEAGACLDMDAGESGGLDDDGWSRQYCNEMVMPFAQSGVSDMFLPAQIWDEGANTASC